MNKQRILLGFSLTANSYKIQSKSSEHQN